jgi:hypothetical protein
MSIQAHIQPGACGLATTVRATCTDGFSVLLEVESKCPKVQAMAAALPPLDALDEVLRRPLVETTPARMAGEHKFHATCPVPMAMLKAVEAAAGLALPSRCEILVEQTT